MPINMQANIAQTAMIYGLIWAFDFCISYIRKLSNDAANTMKPNKGYLGTHL